jgi:pilus assembly protein CpaE
MIISTIRILGNRKENLAMSLKGEYQKMLSKNITGSVIYGSGTELAEIQDILETLPQIKLINQTCNPEDLFDTQHIALDIVLVELNAEMGVPDWLEELAQSLPQAAIIVCSQNWKPDFLLQATRLGIHEFLTMPFTRADLLDILERICPRNLNQPEDDRKGHVIAVTGYKGGVGVTTIAINLAIALAGVQTANKVALVDLGRPFADVANFLNQKVNFSLSDLIHHKGDIDTIFLHRIMHKYGSNIDILNGFIDIEDHDRLETDILEHIFYLLRTMYDYIVVDVGQGVDAFFQNIINDRDMVLLVSGLTVADLKNLEKVWPSVTEWGGGYVKIKVVVNRLNKDNSIQLKYLKEIIQSPPFETLPSDYHLLMDALIQGVPLGIAAPRSGLWHKIKNLAELIHRQMKSGSEEGQDNVSETSSSKRRLLPFMENRNRPTIVGAFLTIFSVGLLALILLLMQHSFSPFIDLTKNLINLPPYSVTIKALESASEAKPRNPSKISSP